MVGLKLPESVEWFRQAQFPEETVDFSLVKPGV
jgi:hypothetical protein